MGRVMGFFTLAIVIGVVTALALDRILVGMLVGGGVLILGIVILISRSGRSTEA